MLRLAALLFATLGVAQTALAQRQGINLVDALRLAGEGHPEILAARADVASARGVLRTSRVLGENPEITGTISSLSSPDTSLTGYEIGVVQRFGISGKRGARVRAAQFRIQAAEARLVRRTQLVRSGVFRAFALARIGALRLTTAQEAEQVGIQVRTAAQDRLDLGAGTLLELNVARAAAARDLRQRLEAERAQMSSLFELAAALGRPATELLEPAGDPAVSALPSENVEDLVQLALANRPDLAAVLAEREAASADLSFARALAIPDPAFGISSGRDDFKSINFGFSFPLPLWTSGSGERDVARAELERARLNETAVRRQVEFEVRNAHQAYTRAVEAQSGFDSEVVERLSENLTLANESFLAGKIGLLVYNTVRRDLVEARLGYLDALADVVERRFELELAIGGNLGESE
jgi:cobalt-zinc-cadmium efflux system outer membrane protein